MELSMMTRFVALIIVVSVTNAREPKCTEFQYQEHLLAKLIRMEIKFELKFENLLNKVTEMQQNVNTGLDSLTLDRNKLSQELERLTSIQEEALNRTVDETSAFMKRVMGDMEAKMKELERDKRSDLGATYTRWGRTVCPDNSTIIYSGYAAGSSYSHDGGAVETICLPKDPQFSSYHPGQSWTSYIYGTEYEANGNAQFQSIFGKPLRDQDVPCAVCKATGRPGILTVPARTDCYSGWTVEYSGYLMTNFHTYTKSTLKCVDADPETINDRGGNDNGDLLYFVEANGQLPDPPYVRGKELTCVICTQ